MAIFGDLFLLRAFASFVEVPGVSPAPASSLRLTQLMMSRYPGSLEEESGVGCFAAIHAA